MKLKTSKKLDQIEELIETEKFQSKNKKACLLLKANEFVSYQSHFTLKSEACHKGWKPTLKNRC